MDSIPSQAVQSSVLAGAKMQAGGLLPTYKCSLELVTNHRFLEMLGASFLQKIMCLSSNYGQASESEMCSIQVGEIFGHLKKIPRNPERKKSGIHTITCILWETLLPDQ